MTEIIAHRGASRESPENTLAAFAAALRQGADGIELDVHASRDGVLVVHHDADVAPNPHTPGVRVPLASLTAAEIAALPRGPDRAIPTLDAVCALVGSAARLYVEVKASGVAPLVAAAIDRHPDVRMAVHAFDHRLPVAVRSMRPGTSIGLLSASYPLDVAAWVGSVQAEAFWQHADLVDAALVQAVHSMGARLICWTVNDAPRARQLVAWGADALCSDVPGAIRAAVTPTG
ncbi:MAG: glycerophosphodiester phosphodiesterase [Gemmatimonadetes bacterium]|nr:glycerophosphodiester phosphodiesterase [Gemmatimonadota bacterium]